LCWIKNEAVCALRVSAPALAHEPEVLRSDGRSREERTKDVTANASRAGAERLAATCRLILVTLPLLLMSAR
jgi:hypothetical protein